MNKAIDRRKAGHFLLDYAHLLALSAVVLVLLIWGTFHFVTRATREEKLRFFLGAYDVSEIGLERELRMQFGESGLREVEFHVYSPASSKYSTYFYSTAANCDFIVLKEKDLLLLKEDVGFYFRSMNENLISALCPSDFDFDFYVYKENIFGIKIHDYLNSEYDRRLDFSSWLAFSNPENEEYDDHFYLLIGEKSPNFASDSDLGAQAGRYLIERFYREENA